MSTLIITAVAWLNNKMLIAIRSWRTTVQWALSHWALSSVLVLSVWRAYLLFSLSSELTRSIKLATFWFIRVRTKRLVTAERIGNVSVSRNNIIAHSAKLYGISRMPVCLLHSAYTYTYRLTYALLDCVMIGGRDQPGEWKWWREQLATC